jgi:hypothetical protein
MSKEVVVHDLDEDNQYELLVDAVVIIREDS